MTPTPSLNLLELLYEAVRAEAGVVVETDDVELLRQKLYKLRSEDPDFAQLSFLISPINGLDLWIVKTEASNGGSGTE